MAFEREKEKEKGWEWGLDLQLKGIMGENFISKYVCTYIPASPWSIYVYRDLRAKN